MDFGFWLKTPLQVVSGPKLRRYRNSLVKPHRMMRFDVSTCLVQVKIKGTGKNLLDPRSQVQVIA